jgi:hypothetical protein
MKYGIVLVSPPENQKKNFFARSRLLMGLQAGLWAEMRVSVNIKQELPGRVGTHQLRRLDIKEPFENTKILRFFARSRPLLGLQVGLWAEMRVSVYINQI